jgi:hypothetical protein
MKVWNVPAEELTRIVTTVSAERFDGNIRFKRTPDPVGRAVAFTLTVANSRGKGSRVGRGGRRICACCWHGHRDIMSAIFAEYPDARLQSAVADYRGRQDFEDSFEATGYANIGSQFEPLCHADACDCDE